MTEWIITSSVLITVVIVLRFLFKGKISRRLQYALWGLVLLRLLMPLPLLSSQFSVMNWAKTSENPVITYNVTDSSRLPDLAPAALGTDATETDRMAVQDEYKQKMAQVRAAVGTPLTVADLFSIIWLIGAIALGLWFIGTNLVFYKQLRKTRKVYDADCKLSVYISEGLASPCLFGILHPAIYLTPKAAENENGILHVFAHELCHYRHGDHIWSLLRGLCLAVWWWNPLVWTAAILSRTDSELACDEGVIKQLGEENRLAYGRTLVDMISVRDIPSGLMHAATTMFSGKHGVKARLNMIIKNPKTIIPAMIAVVLIAALCVGCTFTSAKNTHLSEQEALEKLAASVKHSNNATNATTETPIPTGIVEAGINVPDVVLEKAKELVSQWFQDARASFPDNHYINWKVESLKYSYTYDDFDGMTLQVYRMNYEYLSETPENVVMAGGMYATEDGWIMPSYPDCMFLIFRQDGGTLTFLHAIMENDCAPGDATFTNDLRQALDLAEFNKKLETAVSGYYLKADPANSGDLKIYNVKNYGGGYLVLTEKYRGMGESRTILFFVDHEYRTKMRASGDMPISPCFSANLIKDQDKSIIYGNFKNKKWDPTTDFVLDVQIDNIKISFEDGSVITESVSMDKGYIIVANTLSKIKNIEVYNKNGELQSDLNDSMCTEYNFSKIE